MKNKRLESLYSELDKLQAGELTSFLRMLKAARENGKDLSENAEYDEVRKKLNDLFRRIEELKFEIAEVEKGLDEGRLAADMNENVVFFDDYRNRKKKNH